MVRESFSLGDGQLRAATAPMWHGSAVWLAWLICCWPFTANCIAQTDEIQVYDASIAEVGKFNLTLHNNYTLSGLKEPAYPGAIGPNHTLNGVSEWAYGVTDWYEAGLYLPLYSITGSGAVTFNGFKLRSLFVVPDAAARNFFYGVNFELSYNRPQWDPKRVSSEIRPIIGWRAGRLSLIVNPILDNSFDGWGGLDFAPAERLALTVSRQWTMALEEYADFGPLRSLYDSHRQSHELFGVVDYAAKLMEVELGVGTGLTSASDGTIVKLILSLDLN